MDRLAVESVAVAFIGGQLGQWMVDTITPVKGTLLPAVDRLAVVEGPDARATVPSAGWVLRGRTSFERYVTPEEHYRLAAVSPPLGRPASMRAALIPIRKSAAWWEKSVAERRTIFEEQSHHILLSLPYLPRIARRLHHSRELGEPFDFLTWFEFSPRDAGAFDELVAALRATEEWAYVEREIDIRLTAVQQDAKERVEQGSQRADVGF